MDVHGNRELIYEGAHNVWHAMPVKPRPVPPRSRTAWPGRAPGTDRKPVEPGSFFSADVCEGVPDLPRDAVKYLRVFQLDYKTYSTWNKSYRHSGPAVSIVQEEGVKRILSEVPVEADGSVHFKAPAGRALFFQLLDAGSPLPADDAEFHGPDARRAAGLRGLPRGAQRGPAAARRSGRCGVRPRSSLRRPGAPRASATSALPSRCWTATASSATKAAKIRRNRTSRCGPVHNVFKEPYLTLVGPAGWGNPGRRRRRPGYGIAGAIPVESRYDQNDSRGAGHAAADAVPVLQEPAGRSGGERQALRGESRSTEPASPHRLGGRLLSLHGRGGTARAGRPEFRWHRAAAHPPARADRPGGGTALSFYGSGRIRRP